MVQIAVGVQGKLMFFWALSVLRRVLCWDFCSYGFPPLIIDKHAKQIGRSGQGTGELLDCDVADVAAHCSWLRWREGQQNGTKVETHFSV